MKHLQRILIHQRVLYFSTFFPQAYCKEWLVALGAVTQCQSEVISKPFSKGALQTNILPKRPWKMKKMKVRFWLSRNQEYWWALMAPTLHSLRCWPSDIIPNGFSRIARPVTLRHSQSLLGM
eukprot:NODE_1069_length_1511_cov_0.232295.p2 type:complete len:122 gc:universal NODE_1069_length_1511_cov_0.232295:1351-986(-)